MVRKSATKMFDMSRVSINLLMVWLLVGSPPLCRAGVLSDCCEHEVPSAAIPQDAIHPPCCNDSGEHDGSTEREPEQLPRECGSCAGVCMHVAKPSDDSSDIDFSLATYCAIELVITARPSQGHDTTITCAYRPPCLPYPASDLPLLI